MENFNKTKLVLVIIIALVVITAIILGVIFFVNREKPEDPFENAGTISGAESEFDGLSIKKIEMSYNEEKNETVIDFAIENTTDTKIEKQKIDVQLLNEKEQLISGVQTNVQTIDAKSEYTINMILGGKIEGIKKIKLVKPAEAQVETEPEAEAE